MDQLRLLLYQKYPPENYLIVICYLNLFQNIIQFFRLVVDVPNYIMQFLPPSLSIIKLSRKIIAGFIIKMESQSPHIILISISSPALFRRILFFNQTSITSFICVKISESPHNAPDLNCCILLSSRIRSSSSAAHVSSSLVKYFLRSCKIQI